MRGFRFPETRERIIDRLITPLEKEGYTVHTFFHTYSDREYVEMPADFPVTRFSTSRDADADTELAPHMAKFEFPPEITTYSEGMGYCAARGWFKHHMSTKLVNELRLQHAAQHGISYDWTIFTSPQMEPQTCDVSDYLPPPGAAGECWVPGYAKFGGVYTSFAVCTERAANGMAAMYDWLLADGWAAADFAQAASRYPSRHVGVHHKPTGPALKVKPEITFQLYVVHRLGCVIGELSARFHRVRWNGDRINH